VFVSTPASPRINAGSAISRFGLFLTAKKNKKSWMRYTVCTVHINTEMMYYGYSLSVVWRPN
jgi:hypothetical protein